MAKSEFKVNINIEKAVHKTLLAFAQALANENNIAIDAVFFDYVGAPPTIIVKSVRVESTFVKG